MEDKYLVAKTLLLCYPHLDDLFDVLTESSENCVKSGFYAIFPNEQMRLYERIMRYENRKVVLYDMKYLVEECFRRASAPALSLLKEKYIGKKDMNELMQKFGVCLRTCYRQIKKGIMLFSEELEKLGFDKKKLLTEFGDEPLFQMMLTRVIREDDAERAEKERSEQKPAINNPLRHPLPQSNSDHACCF